MRIRFQADNDLNTRIIGAVLRLNPSIDFKTAAQAGFHTGSPDPEVLEAAAREERVLVSHDQRTLPWHFASFVETRTSPGVIIIAQSLSVGDAAKWLHLIWEAGHPDEYLNHIEIIASVTNRRLTDCEGSRRDYSKGQDAGIRGYRLNGARSLTSQPIQ